MAIDSCEVTPDVSGVLETMTTPTTPATVSFRPPPGEKEEPVAADPDMDERVAAAARGEFTTPIGRQPPTDHPSYSMGGDSTLPFRTAL